MNFPGKLLKYYAVDFVISNKQISKYPNIKYGNIQLWTTPTTALRQKVIKEYRLHTIIFMKNEYSRIRINIMQMIYSRNLKNSVKISVEKF